MKVAANRKILTALLALLSIGAALGIGVRSFQRLQVRSRWNLLFVLVDTTRADFLSSYGFDEKVSPHLEELARSSIVFENVMAQSNCTFPSVNSIFTSRYPWPFLDRSDPDFLGIPKSTQSFAEILKADGYRTVAISASPIVRARPGTMKWTGGFERGFDLFDERCEWKSADCIVNTALTHLRGGPRPLALYLHFFDPHDPYRPPPGFTKRFTASYEGPPHIERGDPMPLERQIYLVDKEDTRRPQRYRFLGFPEGIRPDHVNHLKNLYSDEIAYFDFELGRLIEYLDEHRLLDRTLVVVASDHGEDFLEHGHIRHCHSLFRSQTWTPLLIRLPRGRHSGRRQALVQNIDLVPTILDYLKVQTDGLGFEGQSLRAVIESDAIVNQYAFSVMGDLLAVRNDRYRLIVDRGEDQWKGLFDLRYDPGEKHNLYDDLPRVASELSRALEEWEDRTRGPTELRSPDSAAEDQLRALGYLE